MSRHKIIWIIIAAVFIIGVLTAMIIPMHSGVNYRKYSNSALIGFLANRRTDTGAMIELIRRGENQEIIESLKEASESQDGQTRFYANILLFKFGVEKEQRFENIINALSEPEGSLRVSTAIPVFSTDDTEYALRLVGLLEENQPSVEGFSIEFLGLFADDPQVFEALQPYMHSENPQMRARILESFHRGFSRNPALAKNEALLTTLIDSLHDEDSGVRWRACSALSHFKGNKSAISELINIFYHDSENEPQNTFENMGNPTVREIALRSLYKIAPGYMVLPMAFGGLDNIGLRTEAQQIIFLILWPWVMGIIIVILALKFWYGRKSKARS